MKKLYPVALLVLFACSQEPVVPVEPETVTFSAEIAAPDATKTQLGDKTGTSYPNYWSAGDAISVNGISSGAIADDSEYVGTAKATFTIQGVINAPYYCAYPAPAISSYSNGSAVVTLPATQRMSATSYDASAFVMAGSSSSALLTFSPLVSVVKLTIPGSYDARVSSVLFESLGSEKVSGQFSTDFSSLSPRSGASSRVCVYAYGDGTAFGSSMYMVIPAQTYTCGMRFTIRATDGTQMTFSTSSSFTAQPGKVYPLTARTYVPEQETIPDGLFVMSSNVRFASARDKSNNPDTGDRDWTNRRSAYYAMVNNYRPAIIGLQEAEREQVSDIKSNCSGYNHYGLGNKLGEDITKSDGAWNLWGYQNNGESSTILYRTDLITLNSSGTVWHSDTPNKAGTYFSGISDSKPQASAWAIMTYKPTNTQFFLMNVHLSIYDTEPQEIALIMNTVNSKNTGNLPVIIIGDWNLKDGDSWLNPLEAVYYNARHRAQKTDDYGSYHWWGTESKKIDHIYYKGIGDCYLFRTDARKWNDKYVSDHYPVFAVFGVNSSTPAMPVANFEIPGSIQIDEPATFTDLSSSPSGIAYWEWDFDGIRSNEQNPIVTFTTIKSDVQARLTVIDNNGNMATATKFIEIEGSDEHAITQVWSRAYDTTEGACAYWGSPAVNAAGNRIYVSSSGYHLVGFNSSGTQIGSYDLSEYSPNMPASLTFQTPTPSIDIDGNVYMPVQYQSADGGNGGLFSLKGDLTAKNWYVPTGPKSQYRNCIPAILGDYVSVLLRNVGGDFDNNMLIFSRKDGTLNQQLNVDKGSYGGMAVSADGKLIVSTARGSSEDTGGGFKVAVIDGEYGTWKVSSNSDTGRSYNLLGLAHTDGNNYMAKGNQPAISTIDGSVYVVSTTTAEDILVCARYSLNSYVYNSVPTPIWKVEVEAAANNFGLGCVLDDEGNAYVRAANKVFKLNASDGSLLWEFTTGTGNCGVPAIDNMGYVYVTDSGKQRIYKLSPQNGSLVSQIIISGYQPRTSPTIDYSGNIYVAATSNSDEGAYLFKFTCPKTTGPGANWSQLGGNPMKTCVVPGATEPYNASGASHQGYMTSDLY
ncbi:MAG: PQQ-binding-like beta-propeller repeat protein [Bacteroidales bacterium]|nr:PQQ-binding-like beta-propeller repeat protein [Bacteroidales bacterium]